MSKNNALQKKSSFTSSLGFVLAAAGSAVGLGNIWRFPILAAKNGGGLFLLIYIILVLTFGFALLTTDIAIGRKTGKNPLYAFDVFGKKWKFLGVLSFLVPSIILTYYSVIGGWITKFMVSYVTTSPATIAGDDYFTSFICSDVSPIVFMFIFLALTAIVVFFGVEKGIEKFSKFVMPGLLILIVGIVIFVLFTKHTDAAGNVVTGWQGAAYYLIPRFEEFNFGTILNILLDATNQMFYSLSVAMGIMITYGSYVSKETNLSKSVTQIQLFDTAVAILAGLMVVPAVYVFMGTKGLEKAGPSLIFVSLPKVFDKMGAVGPFVAVLFFIMVLFAALTSSVSIMETIVANCMQKFNLSRKKTSLIIFSIFLIASMVICMGYTVLMFSVHLPNMGDGETGQLLDIMDYISNYIMMPVVCILTCILIGWIAKPKWVIDEIEQNGVVFKKKKLYSIIVKYVAPVVMLLLLLKALGLF